MILDETTLLSDDQAITATAASTNYIDLGAAGTPYGAAAALERDVGKGNPIPFLVQVTENFNTLTSLNIALQVDDNTSFSSATTVIDKDIVLADLVAGKQIPLDFLPKDVNERYARLNYTVTGTNPTLGKITAGISMGNQTNNI